MDDLVVIVLIVFVMVNAVRSSKKKKQKGQAAGQIPSSGKGHAAAQKDRQADFFAAFARPQESGAQKRPAQPRVTPPRAAADDCLHAPGIHLHEVTQDQLRTAQEGEDPCHAGGAPAAMPEEAAPGDPLREALANDLLRGVIMSEILTRPCQRQTAIGRRTKA